MLIVDTLLSAIVGRGRRLHAELARGRSGHLAEELVRPLAQARLGGAVGNKRDVGLRVGSLSKVGERVLVEVVLRGGRKRGVDRRAKTVMECKGVGGIQSDGAGVRGELGLVDLNYPLDILLELVG